MRLKSIIVGLAAGFLASSAAKAECDPREYMVRDVSSIQQSSDVALAFVLTANEAEYENAKKNGAGSGNYGLFSAGVSYNDARERARQIAQSTKFDFKSSYALNYFNQSISGKALDALTQCFEKDKERPGLALWLKRRDGDYYTFQAFWVGANAGDAAAKYDSEPFVDGGVVVSKPSAWLKAKTEEIVVKRAANADFYLKLSVGGETRAKVIVKDPPNVIWQKQPVLSDRTLVAQTVDRNPGCGAGVVSDAIYPQRPGGYFVSGTRSTSHSTNGPDKYSELFSERPDVISVTVTQSTGACEHVKTARVRLQAIEAYPTAVD